MGVNLCPFTPVPFSYCFHGEDYNWRKYKFKKGQCKSLTFLKSVFWVFCPEKSLALPSPERIRRFFCHINNKINSIFRRWQSKSRRASGAGPQDDKGILIISKWVEIHAHGDTPQPPVKNMVILHLENEFTLLNHLTCSVWYFSKNKLCDYFLKTPITLHVSFGKTERVNLSNKHIQNSPNQLQSQSLFSHSLPHLHWWHANPSFQLLRPEHLEATLIVPFLSHPTFRVSGNPTGFTLSISTVWLLTMLTIVTTVPSHSLSHYNSCPACFNHCPNAPPPIYFQHGSQC